MMWLNKIKINNTHTLECSIILHIHTHSLHNFTSLPSLQFARLRFVLFHYHYCFSFICICLFMYIPPFALQQRKTFIGNCLLRIWQCTLWILNLWILKNQHANLPNVRKCCRHTVGKKHVRKAVLSFVVVCIICSSVKLAWATGRLTYDGITSGSKPVAVTNFSNRCGKLYLWIC